jgi:hypothetical protein
MRRHKNECIAAASTPLEGLRDAAHSMLEMADDDPACPKGCMAINTLIELAPHDADVGRIMNDHIANMRQSLETVIAEAQQAGQVSDKRPPEVITSLMMTFMAGLAATMKGPIDKAQAHQLLDAQFEALM